MQRVLVAHRILDEVRLELFDAAAGAQRVVEVEPLVEVDAPVAVRPDTLANFPALLDDAAHGLVRVVDAADRHVGCAHAKGAIAGVHCRLGPIAKRRRLAARRGWRHEGRAVALAVVAHAAAEQLVDRQFQCFALDVPERQVHALRGHAFFPCPAGRTRR